MLYFIQDFSHLNCLAAYPGNGNLSVVCQFIPEEQRSVNAETLSLAAQEEWNALTENQAKIILELECMIFNKMSKATPMQQCAQIKDAPWLEMCKVGTVPSGL